MRNLKFARKVIIAGALAATALSGAVKAEDLTKTISLSDVASNTYLDWAGNTIVEVFVGAAAHINTFNWDVTLTALPGSFMADAFMALGDSTNFNRLYFLPSELTNPGNGYYAGTTRFTGSVDFRNVSTPYEVGDFSFSLNPDGILRLEFAENMDDLPGADTIWNSAKLTFGYSVSAVPEPSTYAMMLLGLGTVGGLARRRRNRVV